MPPKTASNSYIYKAPVFYIGIFYFLLAAFILVDLTFLISVFNQTGTSYRFGIFMLLFILVYMCYFTAGISHEIEVWKDGRLRLTSLRRTIDTKIEDIGFVEGPFLPIGFVRFRLEREKGYLFANMRASSLNTVLSAIKTVDPHIRFTKIKIL